VFNKMCDDGYSVKYRGQEYKEFVKTLETEVGKDANKAPCLTCWQFITEVQRKVHEAYGHHCLQAKVIKDEASFMHYAKLYHNITWDGLILLIKPEQKGRLDRDKLIRLNENNHDLKTRKDNRGNMKGNPPFLSHPKVPLKTIPGHVSTFDILEKRQEEKINMEGFVPALAGGEQYPAI
jgi:hypothetical protein